MIGLENRGYYVLDFFLSHDLYLDLSEWDDV